MKACVTFFIFIIMGCAAFQSLAQSLPKGTYAPPVYKPPTKEQRNKWLSEMPENVILSAPYTPYKNDELRSLNATEDNVYRLASNAKKLGVNLVWVPGSMGQFQALTVDERKLLLKLWFPAEAAFWFPVFLGSPKPGSTPVL